MKKSASSEPYDPLAGPSPAAIAQLADILSLPPSHGVARPSKEWLARQEQRITSLPSAFRSRYHGSTLAAFLGMEKLLRPRLCRAHDSLDPKLIHFLYTRLRWECATHTDRIRAYRSHFSGDCPVDLKAFVDSISGIASLYLPPGEFDARYGSGLPAHCRFARVESGCPACILAVVGARADLLVYLRASMLARVKRSSPRLLPLVDAWIGCFGTGFGPAMTEESECLAAELARARALVSAWRREQREQGGGGQAHGRRTHSSRRGGWPPSATSDPMPRARIQRSVVAGGDGTPGRSPHVAPPPPGSRLYGQLLEEVDTPVEPQPGAAPGQGQQEQPPSPFDFLEPGSDCDSDEGDEDADAGAADCSPGGDVPAQSAVPPPLNVKGAAADGGSWVSVEVTSKAAAPGEERPAPVPVPVGAASSAYSAAAGGAPSTYVPPRAQWGRPQPQPPSPSPSPSPSIAARSPVRGASVAGLLEDAETVAPEDSCSSVGERRELLRRELRERERAFRRARDGGPSVRSDWSGLYRQG